MVRVFNANIYYKHYIINILVWAFVATVVEAAQQPLPVHLRTDDLFYDEPFAESDIFTNVQEHIDAADTPRLRSKYYVYIWISMALA